MAADRSEYRYRVILAVKEDSSFRTAQQVMVLIPEAGPPSLPRVDSE